MMIHILKSALLLIVGFLLLLGNSICSAQQEQQQQQNEEDLLLDSQLHVEDILSTTFHDATAPNCSTWNSDNRLDCWLWQLQVDIPDQSFSKDWISISIRNMECTQFALSDLESSYQPPHELTASVQSLHASCQGKYHASGGLSGHLSASLTAQSSTLPALVMAFRITPSIPYQIPRPDQWNTTQCQANLKATHLHFSGSASAQLIQAFSGTISRYVTQALQQQLCPLCTSQLDPLLTRSLQSLEQWMEPFLPPLPMSASLPLSLPTAQEPHSLSSAALPQRKLVETDDVTNPIKFPTVSRTLSFLNQQLEQHLQRGWIDLFPDSNASTIPPACQDVYRGLSGWFHALAGSQPQIPLPPVLHNISLPPLPVPASMSLGLSYIQVQGLDWLETFQVFRPIQNRSRLQSTLLTGSEGLTLQVPVRLAIQLERSNRTLEEPFVVHVHLGRFETSLRTALQVQDWNQTSVLQVILAVQRFSEHPSADDILPALGCLIRTLEHFNIQDWFASVILDSISVTRQGDDGFLRGSDDVMRSLEGDLDHVINSVMELLVQEYPNLWTNLAEGLVQTPIRQTVNNYIADWLGGHSSPDLCPPINNQTDVDTPKWLNMTKFVILDRFNEFLNHSTTLDAMNQYLSCVGQALEQVTVKSTLLDQSATSEDHLLELTRIETRHWDSIQEVQCLRPVSDTGLWSSIQWGNTEKDQVPQVETTWAISSQEVSGELNVTIFAGLQASTENVIEYNINQLQNISVVNVLQQVQCGMVPMSVFEFLPESTNADLGSSVGIRVVGILNNQTISFSSDDAGSIPQVSASVVNWTLEWLRSISNQAFEQWIVQSPSTCSVTTPSHHVTPHDHSNSLAWYDSPMVWVVVVVVLLAQGGLVWVAQGDPDFSFHGYLNTNTASYSPVASPPARDEDGDMGPVPLEESLNNVIHADTREFDRALIQDMQEEQNYVSLDCVLDQFSLNESNQENSLVTAKEIPMNVRLLVPILIIGTVALLFSSNVSVGASVDLSIRLLDRTIHVPALFEFSLGNTVVELYGAGIYPLLMLVVVFSGIWPYAKLFWMLSIWMKEYSDQHEREKRLHTLDSLSKFSLVDSYVLVVMLVAFRFHLDFSESLGLDVYVNPKFGFYAFLLATCLSLVLGHGMLHFHRKVQQPANVLHPDVADLSSVFDHGFVVTPDGTRRQLSHVAQVAIFSCCLSAVAFLIIGYGKESYTFDFGGLAGMALGDKNSMTYSLLSLGLSIPQSVEDPQSILIRVLQLTYFFYAVVTPLACLILLLVLLVYPMTAVVQQRMLVAAEIANAWSAVEVFVLSIVAALFQISTFASFIIGDKCDLINQVTQSLIGDDIIPASDSVCFSVDASVKSDCWYLVLGVLLNSFLASFGLRVARAAVEERLHPLESLDYSSIVGQLFHLPGSAFLFRVNDTLVNDNEENEDDESGEQPDWRHWF